MAADISPRHDDELPSVRQGERKTNKNITDEFDDLESNSTASDGRDGQHCITSRKRNDDIATDFATCNALETRTREISSQGRTVTQLDPNTPSLIRARAVSSQETAIQPTMTCIIVCSVWASIRHCSVQSALKGQKTLGDRLVWGCTHRSALLRECLSGCVRSRVTRTCCLRRLPP